VERKIVIHTLESDLQNKNNLANESLQSKIEEREKEANNLIKVKSADYAVLYFTLITLAFFSIIGLLGYFLYLDHRENNAKISVAIEQEPIKTIDIKTIWSDINESDGIKETIQTQNYLIIKVNNFDAAFKLYTENDQVFKSFISKQFAVENLGNTIENIEINNIGLKSFSAATSSPVYGFYFDRALIIARNTDAFKDALQDKDIKKL
jgi:hypothetical protein